MKKKAFATRTIHAGQSPDPSTIGSMNVKLPAPLKMPLVSSHIRSNSQISPKSSQDWTCVPI